MSKPFVLFEISWEVCNKVGGIHTVLSSKAKTMVERYGDDYVCVGPWRLADRDRELPFDEEAGHDALGESCRAMGVPVRLGRWRIPGRPRTLLIDFSRLYDHKDDVLARLWEQYQVDSISGGWDYVEPVLFSHAAGKVIERWWEELLAPLHRRAVVHAHEWMTAATLLYLQPRVPAIGTVFTTHATMLGRALSSLGHSPSDGLGDDTAEGLAREHQVAAKHSIEGIAARAADVFTTVSEITADEAELLHRRRPEPLLPNGIDLDVVDALRGDDRAAVRTELARFASRFLGEDVGDAAFIAISGRYEFHNKGIDVLLEAGARIARTPGRPIVLFVLVPAGNSGPRSEVLDRRDPALDECDGPVGINTHNLFDEEHDPVVEACERLELQNLCGARTKVIQVPVYLGPGDGFLGREYEAVLAAMDLSCFPSYYEPWGYTPQESLAVGVPTITTDYAGFGRWARQQRLGSDDGITVLDRVHVGYDEVVAVVAEVIEERIADRRDRFEACRRSAAKTSWQDFSAHYVDAYGRAVIAVEQRCREGVVQARRPPRRMTVQPAAQGRTPLLRRMQVHATLPVELAGLARLARNLWWCWDAEATALLEELSPLGFARAGRNPVAMLQDLHAEDIATRRADAGFVRRLDAVLARFDRYLAEVSEPLVGDPDESRAEHGIAYFCAEFGLHESLPIYSGGLGVLAGDHVKSASDLNLPLIGVGLFYRNGYLSQRLTTGGEQHGAEVVNDPRRLPLELVRNPDGSAAELGIPLPGRELFVRAWRVGVGRVSVYLLDADCDRNRQEDRDITKNLYGGDQETRIQQEIVLGRGGARLLRHLGLRPAVYHMNEGHAAFLALERVSRLVREEGLTFDAAREHVRANTAFTTHTPVPAGHDRFGEDLVRRYFADVEEWVGVPWARFWSLGAGEGDSFNMTWLALSFATWVNGVSKLHGQVSRRLLRDFWPGLLPEEVPVESITNGIHLPTWTHPAIAMLLRVDRGAGSVRGTHFAERAGAVDPAELWHVRRDLKRNLLDRVEESLQQTFVQRSDSPAALSRILESLDPEALLIGFARRFAPYKRAHLLFQDLERLTALLADSERPVRVLIAGKAHPADGRGKEILQRIVELSRRDDLLGRVVFLEDYDIGLARTLVQGVDLWLNNPTRLQEASGTSGMKAAANGGLNLSIADGWWPEAAGDGDNGWTIAGARFYDAQDLQDQFDSAVLLRLLEEEIVPLYFERDAQGVPQGWMRRVIRCLESIPPVFNTDRMVQDYVERAYAPLAAACREYRADRNAKPKQIAREAQRVRKGFADVRIVTAEIDDQAEFVVGESIDVRVEVELGTLGTDDVSVELVLGHDGGADQIDRLTRIPLEAGEQRDGRTVFAGRHRLERSGSYLGGIRVRARPENVLPDLVVWV